MTADHLFIGIDSGTQGTKAVLFSETRNAVVARSHRGYGLMENDLGGREQDPADWIDACGTVIQDLFKTSGESPKKVQAIGVSGQQHGLVALDKDDQVIRPAKLWCDTQTTSQCRSLTLRLGGDEAVVDLTCNRMAEGFTAPKLLWIKENEPANYDRIRSIMLPHDYINFWLTREKRAEFSDASGTAYFDVKNRQWSTPVLKAIDETGKLEACLPEFMDSRDPWGKVCPDLAQSFGFSNDVLVSSGGGDNMMAAIGTGNVAPGIVTASLGTSGTIYAYADHPAVDPKGEVAAFCSATGGWLPLICTMNLTVATELVRHLLHISIEEMNAAAAGASPGSQGIVLLPYFNGERTPALPQGCGNFFGLTSSNMTRENICRAAMEGPLFGLKYGMERLKEMGITPKEIRLVGGGAKSPLWRRITADILDCPVVCPAETEAGALGAALQALWCRHNTKAASLPVTRVTDRAVRLDPATRLDPDPGHARRYASLYERYDALRLGMTPFFTDPFTRETSAV